MESEKGIDSSFSGVRQEFPFCDYIDISVYHQMRALLRQLRKNIPDFAGKRLLDIGCGPMDKTGIFQLMGFSCYGVDDLSDSWHKRDDNVAKIKGYATRLGINFHHQLDGQHSIPFEKGSFDVVCTFDVIEHLHESPRGLLNTMGAYAKKGGLLAIVMPNSVNLRKRLSVLIGRTNYPPIDQFFHSTGTWRGHVREYTIAEMEYICEQNGFEIVSSITFEHIAQYKLRSPLRQVYMAIGYLMPGTRSGLIVICRKPDLWKPVSYDADKFRQATANSVPKGVA
jgi:SAM-dependent methyltransferase